MQPLQRQLQEIQIYREPERLDEYQEDARRHVVPEEPEKNARAVEPQISQAPRVLCQPLSDPHPQSALPVFGSNECSKALLEIVGW